MKLVMTSYSLGEMAGGFGETTGCPRVRDHFDTPLFSGLDGPITKSFDVLIAE